MIVRGLMLMMALCGVAAAQVPGVKHVVVFGIDGLGPVGLEKAPIPNVSELIKNGAHSFKARGVMPTSSAPNWASMIMGAGPEQHGVLDNKWPLPGAMFLPTEGGAGMIFPTMFRVLREQRPEIKQAMIHDWDGFGILFERKLIDVVINGDKEDDTAAQAIKVVKELKPDLMFVHFDHVDHALHSIGFASEAYFQAVTKMDTLVGSVIAAIKEAGYFDSTLFILTSDHGGKDKGHGGNTMDEITIPWIACGPGVKKGFTITDPINTFDTACTVVHALGAKQPYAWIGRPVLSAFE